MPATNAHVLSQKIALISGGGSGIGLGIAKAFVQAGARVAITGRRVEKLEEAVKELTSAGGEAIAIQGDVSKRDDAIRMVEETVTKFGALHILVNNAGIAKYGTLDASSDEDLDATVDIDLKGPLYLSKAAIPHLKEHQGEVDASILNISTSATLLAVRAFPVYSAAKAGLNQLTKCLAIDLGPDRIRVNALLPGVVETDIFNDMMDPETLKKTMEEFATKHPLGRLGQPKDVADAAVFLSGPSARWITGALLPVDGGLGLG